MIAPQAEFSIAAMCRVLQVSSSGYYAWLRRPKQSRWQQADAKLLAAIRAIYDTPTITNYRFTTSLEPICL